jgi:hypothetical protein
MLEEFFAASFLVKTESESERNTDRTYVQENSWKCALRIPETSAKTPFPVN